MAPTVSLRALSLHCLLIMLISQATAQPSFLYHFCIDSNGNYTANGPYQTNLNTLLSNISSNTQLDYGFYNFSYGQNSDRVNAIGLCRGDVTPDDCRSCLNDSRVLLTQRCPNQKEAIGWYDNCMLRYSSRSIFYNMETSPEYYFWLTTNASTMDEFNKVLRDLLESLRSKAAAGDSRRKFAAGNARAPTSFQTLYAHVQCTPDLSEQVCNDCLVKVISDIPNCCAGKIGGRIGTPSCNLRFDTTLYYDPTAADSPPPPLPPPPSSIDNTAGEGKRKSSRTLVLAIILSIAALVVLLVVVLILICIYLRLKKPIKYFESKTEADDETKSSDKFQFDFHTIEVATDNFSEANKLGQGGFGPVYKGRLPSGKEVAVKRLSKDSGQGDIEFKNEVLLVAKLQHRNLVRLLGFCLKGRERLLVYQFLPNKSLDYFIFNSMKRAHLDWERRYKIVEGIARGLLYLHEDSQLRIIHRDLKASNILLDEEMNPKISDFGMARLFSVDQTHGNTNKIAGTYGYMPPEYALHGQFSMKSDVFSFGVLVLEIVSGYKNNSIHHGEYAEHLVSFAWKNWSQGTVSNIVDPTLNDGSRNDIMKCIQIGLLCVQKNVADRPTMASVVLMLSSYSLCLPIPSKPAYFVRTMKLLPEEDNADAGTTRSSESRNNSVEASVNEASITELSPR